MKILLTGAEGFIGTRLIKVLKKSNDVISYDLVNGDDIRDTFKLDKLFETENFDAVVHLAALAGVRRGEEFPDEYISTNITGTQNLVNLCKKYGVKKFLSYSSSSVLGGNANKDKGLVEEDEYKPKGVYAISKVAGEYIVKNSGLDYIVIRPFTVYGSQGRKDMVIYKWINQILSGQDITYYGDGQTSRGYTYVDDLVKTTDRLLNELLEHNLTETYNLGGSEKINLDDLLQLFMKHCVDNRIDLNINRMDLPNADVVHSFANTNKAKKDINFNPQKKFKKVVKQILINELKEKL